MNPAIVTAEDKEILSRALVITCALARQAEPPPASAERVLKALRSSDWRRIGRGEETL